jgi:hypothetical protein
MLMTLPPIGSSTVLNASINLNAPASVEHTTASGRVVETVGNEEQNPQAKLMEWFTRAMFHLGA